MKKILLLISLISSYSFGYTYGEPLSFSCSSLYYLSASGNAVKGGYLIQSYQQYSENKLISSTATTQNWSSIWYIQRPAQPNYHDVWSASKTCVKKPVCTAPQVLDETVNPPVCRVPCDDNQTRNETTGICEDNIIPECTADNTELLPPDCTSPTCDDNQTLNTETGRCVNKPDMDGDGIPDDIDPDIDGDGEPNVSDDDVDGDGIPNATDPDIDGDGVANADDDPYTQICPSDQINTSNDLEILSCACANGLPFEYDFMAQKKVCPKETQCKINYDNKALRQQNETSEYCLKSYPVHLFNVVFLSPEQGLTCCYASPKNVAAEDPNSTAPTETGCITGYHKDTLDRCIEDSMPPLEDNPLCSNGQIWDNFTQGCKDNPLEAANPTDGEGGSGSEGSDTNYTAGNPYTGGDTSDPETAKDATLEYNAGESNDMLNEYSGAVTDKITSFISENVGGVLSLYKVSIPVASSCGCSDPTFNFNALGKHYEKTVELCSPLTSILDLMRPMLWFLFLLGMLFAFFRGN